MFIGIRNRYCVICQKSNNKNQQIPKHVCFMNWSKSATGMEADAIIEGFKQSVEMHGLKYNKLIGKIFNFYILRFCQTYTFVYKHFLISY